MIDKLLKENRRYEIEHHMLRDTLGPADRAILHAVIDYADRYFTAHGLDIPRIISSYEKTIHEYVADIAAFKRTGRYPRELSPTARAITRTDYDIFLLLTVLLTKHRFSVMRAVSAVRTLSGKVLVIGVGSGVELTFIAKDAASPVRIDVYDLAISPFVRTHFKTCAFHETPYRHTGISYSTIYAIEVLEHLADPFALLEECRRSLVPGGLLIVTTAKNVPQFDHMYNFTSARSFERKIRDIGFSIVRTIAIPHRYPFSRIGARNTFYILKNQQIRSPSRTFSQ